MSLSFATRRIGCGLLGVMLAGCVNATIGSAQSAPVPATAPVAPPRLVVFITVDQLIPEYFERFGPQFTGGLARLRREGAFFTNAWHDHAVTETAPGHASTLSGRFPRSTGVVANDRGVQDEQSPLVGGGGAGASPYRFRGSVLYDWMRSQDPTARALSVSRKDRGAILPMGRAGQEVFWYAGGGRMTTSVWYADTLPTWVQRFNARRIPHSYAGREWTLLLPENAYPEPDSVVQESGGKDFVFPHRLTADTAALGWAFAGFPWMDEMLLQFALAGLKEMGLGDTTRTDLLAVSLSTTDAVGHQFGPDSREAHDHLLRLDRALGAFIDSLYKVRDSSTIAIALTSDHGVAAYPQLYASRNRLDVLYADVRPLVRAVADTLSARGAPGDAFVWDWGMLYVKRPALRAAGLDPDSLVAAFGAALRKVPGIDRVYETRMLASSDTVADPIARRWLHMIPPDFDVPLVASMVPGAYWAGTTYATHGTPHDYDARVPVVFHGRWFAPGVYDRFVRVVDMAPTLAHVVGVPPTEPLDGKVLTEALAAPRGRVTTGADAGAP